MSDYSIRDLWTITAVLRELGHSPAKQVREIIEAAIAEAEGMRRNDDSIEMYRRLEADDPDKELGRRFHPTAVDAPEWARSPAYRVRVSDQSLDLEEVSKHFLRDDFGSLKVTPTGAQMLVDLQLEGGLPVPKKPVAVPSPRLQEYIESEAALREKLAQSKQRAAQIDQWLERPEDPCPVPLTTTLMDRAFWKHRGGGGGAMRISGCTVNKVVSRHKSNSGKSVDFSVSFRWTDEQGVEHDEPHVNSKFEGNRRSDPERNWGLGRE